MSQHPSAPPSPKTDIAPEVIAANSKDGQVLSLEETEGVLSGAVQAPGSEGLTPTKKSSRRKSSGEVSSQMPTSGTAGSDLGAAGDESRVSSVAGEEVVEDSDEEYMDEDERIIAAGGAGIPIDENGNPRPLLAELTPSDHGRKCLVLDLDETLLHSSFKVCLFPTFASELLLINGTLSKPTLRILSFQSRLKTKFIMYTFSSDLVLTTL
jgi:RNA polymerase II subunit A small phosphatase-like protein